MKSVGAALIIMGAILILTPAVMDYLYQLNVIHLLAVGGATSSTLAKFGGGYRLLLIIFGMLMVFVGIGMGFTALDTVRKSKE